MCKISIFGRKFKLVEFCLLGRSLMEGIYDRSKKLAKVLWEIEGVA